MNAVLRKDALTETFNDVEKLIYATVYRFINTYGGDFEEMVSVAFLTFCDAYEKYDDSITDFHKYLGNRVFHALGDFARKEARFKKGDTRDKYTKDYVCYGDGLISLLCDLDNDAKNIIQLIFDPPRFLRGKIKKVNGDNSKVLKILLMYLKEEQNWTRSQFAHAKKQIVRALYD